MENNSVQKKENIRNLLLIWLLTGIIVSFSAAAMLVSGRLNINNFYDVGSIYDVQQRQKSNTIGAVYDEARDICVATEERAAQYIDINGGSSKWRNMVFQAQFEGDEERSAMLEFYDQDGQMIQQIETMIKKGRNVVKLDKIQFTRCIIWLEQAQGQEFLFDEIKLYTRKPVSFYPRGYKYAAVIFVAYTIGFYILCLVVRAVLARIRKKTKRVWDWYAPIRYLQILFCKAAHVCSFAAKLSNRTRNRVRTVLFLILFIYTYVIWEYGLHNPLYLMHKTVGTMLVVLIGLFSIEGEIKPVNWRNNLVLYWHIFWIFTIVSDFVVKKRFFGHIGWIMLIPFEFTFLMWHNMRRREEILKNMTDAVEAAFWINLAVCIFLRPFPEAGMRYSGTASNPVLFGLYMAVMAVMFYVKMENTWRTPKKTEYFCAAAGFGAALYLLWKTQSLTGLGAIALLVPFWLCRLHLQKTYFFRKESMLWVAATGATVLATVGIIAWCLGNVSELLHLDTVFPYEVLYAKANLDPFALQVQAAPNRVLEKLADITNLEKLTTERNLYWIAYLRSMNLFGHTYKHRFWGSVHWPHNQILWIGYSYGVLAIVPYVMMIIGAVRRSARRVHVSVKKGAYEILPFAVITCVMIMSMVDNIERTFGIVPWYLLYLLMGYVFAEQKNVE